MSSGRGDVEVVRVTDERDPLALKAIAVIRGAVWEVQPTDDLLSEVEESRRGLPTGGAYHLLAAVTRSGRVIGAVAGAYLAAVNAGYVAYLAVEEARRSARLGSLLRERLVEEFRADALRERAEELRWVVGEVRRENRWLRRLVRDGRAVPFDLSYFHPWLPRSRERVYVLYRESIADARTTLPTAEVEALLYAIWRRAYRVSYPTQSDTFCYMMEQLEGRTEVGADPEFGGQMRRPTGL